MFKASIILIFILGWCNSAWSQSSINDRLEAAQNYYDSGKDAYYDGNYNRARLLYDSCLIIRTDLLEEPHKLLYKVHSRIANNYIKIRSLSKAKFHLDKARVNAEGTYGVESDQISGLFMDYASYYSKKMLIHKALEWNKKAIDINSKLYGPESIEVAYVLMNMGIDVYKQGDYVKCIQLYDKVYEVYKKHLNPEDENFNRVYNNVAMAHRKIGNLEKALDYAEKALEIKLKNYEGEHPSVAKYYSNLGRVQSELNQFQEAKDNYKKSIDIFKKRYGSNHSNVAGTYGDMAGVFLDSGNPELALEMYTESYNIIKTQQEDNFLTYISSLNNIAVCKDAIGRTEEAISEILHVNELLNDSDSRDPLIIVQNLLFLSQMSRHQGDSDQALSYLKTAKNNSKEIPNLEENSLLTVQLLFEESKIYRDKGEQLDIAQNQIEKAIKILIELRKSYLGSSSKEYLNQKLESIFSTSVEIALAQYNLNQSAENINKIFVNIEKAKAASFWDNESEENAFYYGRVPKDVISEIELMKNSIGDLQYELNFRSDGDNLESKDSLFHLKNDLQNFMADVEKSYPDFYAIKYQLHVPEIPDIQKRLDKNMSVLDYFFLDRQLICLVISKDDINLKTIVISEDLDEIDFSRGMLSSKEEKLVYETVFSQITEILQKNKSNRISIIPHKSINYLSFEQLKNPKTGKSLLYDYAFSYQHNSKAFLEKSNKKGIDYLGFAPDWSFHDSDIDINTVSRNELIALPGAMEEIREVSKLISGKMFLGAEANEENYKKEIGNNSVLHFATHAYLDPENETKSCLYLHSNKASKDVFEEDGNLYFNEISDSEIDASLVILSACNTGNGITKSGEGVMSLSRAFRYAGAKSLLMSLWLANDQSSQPIIVEFMKNLKKGVPKDIALQKAKINYLESADPMMKDEFYWAGFQLNGELDPLVRSVSWIYYLIAGLFILLIGYTSYQLLDRYIPN